MRIWVSMLAACLVALPSLAEPVSERQGFTRLESRPALFLKPDTKTLPNSQVRIFFWVGRKGGVEAVEQSCGDLELFDDIVDAVLEWKFKTDHPFTTELSFVRRGHRVFLVMELPRTQRPRRGPCEQTVARFNEMKRLLASKPVEPVAVPPPPLR